MLIKPFFSRLLSTFKPAPTSRAGIFASSSMIESTFSQISLLGDPDVILLKAGIQRQSLRELEGDDEISAALETRRDAVLSTPWRLEPDKTRAAKFIDAELRPHADTILRAMWDAVPYGYSVVKVEYARRGSQVGIERVLDMPFEDFTPSLDGLLDAMTGDPVDERKFFCCVRRPTVRNPRGEALLSRAYWPWFFRKHGWQYWMKYLERCGIPFIVGKTTAPDRQAAMEALQQAVQNSVIVHGPDDKIESLELGRDPKIFTEFETAVTRRIQKLILGQTLTSGTDGGSGNRALGQVHDLVRQERKRSDVLLLTAGVQRVINQIAALNNWVPAPVFVMEDAKGLGLERAQRDKILVEADMVKLTKEYLLERYDFNEGDFEVLETEESAGEPLPTREQQGNAEPEEGEESSAEMGLAKQGQQFTPEQEAIEDLGTAALDEAGAAPIPISDVRSAIFGAKDPDDLADRLAVLLDQQDPLFADTLARAQFAAAVVGYVHAEER